MNNLFITFEGGDGSGKSTQVDLLKDHFDKLNLSIIKTREPGGTPSAEILRDILTKGEVNRWTPMSEALLMWAARHEHLVNVIEPALKSGKIVICDRFYDSTFAYQGVAHNLGIDKMIELKKIDSVAYIRFSSVYREFKDLSEFQAQIDDLNDKIL